MASSPTSGSSSNEMLRPAMSTVIIMQASLGYSKRGVSTAFKANTFRLFSDRIERDSDSRDIEELKIDSCVLHASQHNPTDFSLHCGESVWDVRCSTKHEQENWVMQIQQLISKAFLRSVANWHTWTDRKRWDFQNMIRERAASRPEFDRIKDAYSLIRRLQHHLAVCPHAASHVVQGLAQKLAQCNESFIMELGEWMGDEGRMVVMELDAKISKGMTMGLALGIFPPEDSYLMSEILLWVVGVISLVRDPCKVQQLRRTYGCLVGIEEHATTLLIQQPSYAIADLTWDVIDVSAVALQNRPVVWTVLQQIIVFLHLSKDLDVEELKENSGVFRVVVSEIEKFVMGLEMWLENTLKDNGATLKKNEQLKKLIHQQSASRSFSYSMMLGNEKTNPLQLFHMMAYFLDKSVTLFHSPILKNLQADAFKLLDLCRQRVRSFPPSPVHCPYATSGYRPSSPTSSAYATAPSAPPLPPPQ